MKPQTFLMVGISGCGKGTQKDLLQKYVAQKDPERKQFLLSTGNGFRDLAKVDSYTGHEVKKLMDGGGLIPVFLAVRMWADAFIENIDGDEHVFIDGAPRRLPESEAFDSAFKFYKREKPHIIFINVSIDTARKRLMGRGRRDDEIEFINRRLGWFEEFVVPAINFFRDNPDYHFIEVNGEQGIATVQEEITSKLVLM